VDRLRNISPDEIRKQLAKVCHSPKMRMSRARRQILEILVARLLDPGRSEDELKTTSIGELALMLGETMGRIDVHRTAMHVWRLRKLLDRMFTVDKFSGIRFTIPKDDPGHYYVEVSLARSPDTLPLYGGKFAPPTMNVAEPPAESHVVNLWASLIECVKVRTPTGEDLEVLIAFSNEQPELGDQQNYRGLYSGSGEVVAAYVLGCMFTKMRVKSAIARSRSLINREAPASNTVRVYLGSSLANAALRGLLSLPCWQHRLRFRFESWLDPKGKMHGAIVDTRPEPGAREKYIYEWHPEKDYALVSMLIDFDQNIALVILCGLSTLATEAATRFAMDDDGAANLIEELRRQFGYGPFPISFEALLELTVEYDQPSVTRIRIVQCHS